MTIEQERMAVRYALMYTRIETARLDQEIPGLRHNRQIQEQLISRNQEMKRDMAQLEELVEQYM